MTRLLTILAAGALAAAAAGPLLPEVPQAPPAGFSVVEASIADLRLAMEEGRTTSRDITARYLARIERYEGRLHAVLALNPRALEDAGALDAERRQGRVRGPLHGIPVALKDNIHTLEMPTTGGALAFATLRPPYEATLTRLLREAGAVILAKTTMTELANWVATGMPSGYNALASFSANPYDPPRVAGPLSEPPRLTPGGSSSGIGTAASFWAASVGTETSGSILNPSNQTMLVGIKPTVGRVSRYGVIPITADQDTPGPMARSVADAAALLGAMEGAAPDPQDPATRACTPPPGRDYTRHLRADGLRGARIGIPHAGFVYRVPDGSVDAGRALSDAEERVLTDAADALRRAGATIVDPADLPSALTRRETDNVFAWPICAGLPAAATPPDGCSIVFQYGMKRDFNAWLASLGDRAPVKTLTELRAWNRAHRQEGALRYGQNELDASDAIDLERDRARYEADRAKDLRLARDEGLDAALAAGRLDALLFPSYYGSAVAGRAGYPSVTVPFATVPLRVLGFSAAASNPTRPFGVTFTGPACSEPRLIELAYAFEQATTRRVAPALD